MGFLLGLLAALLLLAAVYLFLIAPNVLRRKVRCPELLSWDYAHRGLHDENRQVPENSLAAFRLAVEAGYGIELDVHLTRDQKMVVHHDNSLKRMCGEDKRISDLPLEELRRFSLGNTAEGIPTFDEVLDVVNGRVPLLIELKSDRRGDTTLAGLLYTRLRTYQGVYCVESFDPLVVRWFKKHAPEVVRGQLAWDKRVSKGKYKKFEQFVAAHLLLNFLSRPDFVAYGYKTDQCFSFRVMRNLFRPMLAAWTVRSQEDLERLRHLYDLQIFEAIRPRRCPGTPIEEKE